MATLAQLEAEDEWWDEIVTTELDWLGDQLCSWLGISRGNFGAKGDENHLNGGHRSQDWIQNSQYCNNHSYTVQSNLSGEQVFHIGAGDLTPGSWGTTSNRQLVAAHTNALWNAALAGQLPGITQVEGTLNGSTPAGLNLPSGSTFTPNSSHLDHWHLTFDRRFMRDMSLMQRIYNTVTGAGGDQMYTKQGDGLNGQPPNQNAMYLQRQLVFLRPEAPTSSHPLTVDGKYGSNTAYWVSVQLTGGNGDVVDGNWFAVLDQQVAAKTVADAGTGQGPVGPAGPAGPEGPQGEKGDKGDTAVLAAGTTLKIV